jgi:lipoprotein-anchoring transpeptidase ErfK/SrfK
LKKLGIVHLGELPGLHGEMRRRYPWIGNGRTLNSKRVAAAAGQCTMRFSILVWGQKGVYIHEWPSPATFAGNGGPTHGCIHLDPGRAALVYAWVDRPTRLLIGYPW